MPGFSPAYVDLPQGFCPSDLDLRQVVTWGYLTITILYLSLIVFVEKNRRLQPFP